MRTFKAKHTAGPACEVPDSKSRISNNLIALFVLSTSIVLSKIEYLMDVSGRDCCWCHIYVCLSANKWLSLISGYKDFLPL